MSENTIPAIDRTIYPMPMFANFRVRDIAAATAFYEAVGFVALAAIPGPDGTPVVVHLRRMKYQDLLLVPGDAVTGSTTVSFSAGGEDLAARAKSLRAGDFPAAAVEGPTDTAWFTSDVTIDDPDGNRIILTAPREADMEQAKAWAETFEGEWVGKN